MMVPAFDATPSMQPELILAISMTEERFKDGGCVGALRATVYRYREEVTWAAGPTGAFWGEAALWEGLVLRTDYSNLFSGKGPLYDIQWGYVPASGLVQLHDIDRIAQGLTVMKTALDAIVQADGPAQSLGQDVLSYMRVMGITKAYWLRDKWGTTAARWQLCETPAEIRAYIDAAFAHCVETPRTAQDGTP